MNRKHTVSAALIAASATAMAVWLSCQRSPDLDRTGLRRGTVFIHPDRIRPKTDRLLGEAERILSASGFEVWYDPIWQDRGQELTHVLNFQKGDGHRYFGSVRTVVIKEDDGYMHRYIQFDAYSPRSEASETERLYARVHELLSDDIREAQQPTTVDGEDAAAEP